mgnify:CR=1 FL=1
MNNEKITKSEIDNRFLAAFEREVVKIEKRNIKDLKKFYQKNYDQGISNFIKYNTTNYQTLFTYKDLAEEYQKMYISIGNHIAKWYFGIFKKYQTKADAKSFESEWERSFADYGGRVAATNVTLVSGTAKKTLEKLTQQLMRDPEFMQLGNEAKARVLRNKFSRYSAFQANRLVRTESTRAANFAVEKSAKTLFSENDLSKRWLAVMDGKERIWHRAANGQTVRINEKFIVGGEAMSRPGEGSARNVINCRCRIIPIPDENAIPVTELDEIGVGLGQSRIEDFSLANLTNAVDDVIDAITTSRVVEELSQKDLMRPDNWDDFAKGAVINDDYLELLNTVPTLRRGKGAFYRSSENLINISNTYKGKMLEKVLAHEFGHAIHYQNGWIIDRYLYYSNGVLTSSRGRFVHPIIKKLIEKQGKIFGNNLRGAARTKLTNEWKRKYFKAFYGKYLPSDEYKIYTDYLKYKLKVRKQFPKLSDDEFESYYTAMTDYIGGLTKGRVGQGHASSYMAKGVTAEMELFAHMVENKFVGNPVFKKLHPDIYKESIEALDELIKLLKP